MKSTRVHILMGGRLKSYLLRAAAFDPNSKTLTDFLKNAAVFYANHLRQQHGWKAGDPPGEQDGRFAGSTRRAA